RSTSRPGGGCARSASRGETTRTSSPCARARRSSSSFRTGCAEGAACAGPPPPERPGKGTMLAIAALLLLSPQTTPTPPKTTQPPQTPSMQAAPDERVVATGRGYRIGPGDILRVTVYGHEDLTQTVVVQPGGKFAFPLIGAVTAGELTPSEVEARIVGALSKGLIRDPQVTVVVQEYRSKVIFVVGEVTRPGAYPLTGETSAVEILSRAGPLLANAGT